MGGGVPIRTCVGCRRKLPQSDLLRVVMDDRGSIRPATVPRRQGRGAYVCPDVDCMERARRVKGFDRAFRRPVAVPAGVDLAEAFAAQLRLALDMALRGGRAGRRVAVLDSLLEQLDGSLQGHGEVEKTGAGNQRA